MRVSPSEVAVLDGERWAAPLSDELHAAFTDTLQEQLGARDVEASGTKKTKYIIHIAIRRFESVPGQQALIDADWSVREAKALCALMCTSQSVSKCCCRIRRVSSGPSARSSAPWPCKWLPLCVRWKGASPCLPPKLTTASWRIDHNFVSKRNPELEMMFESQSSSGDRHRVAR